jgi:hypothetical protein
VGYKVGITHVRTEKVACRAAITQALRYHFHKRPKEIAKLMKMKRQNVSLLTNGDATVLQWYERRHQEEAIAAALKILGE